MTRKVAGFQGDRVLLVDANGQAQEYALDNFDFQPRVGDEVDITENAGEILITKAEAAAPPPARTPAPKNAPQSPEQVQPQQPQGGAPSGMPLQPQQQWQQPPNMPLAPAPMPQQFSWAAPPVSFGDAIKICLKKYVDFSGRASRSEFWYFILFYTILLCIPGLDAITSWALLLPSLAVGARRMHDTGKSGWWQLLPDGLFVLGLILIFTIPPLGAVLILASLLSFIIFCFKGHDAPNRFDVGQAPPQPQQPQQWAQPQWQQPGQPFPPQQQGQPQQWQQGWSEQQPPQQ